MADTKKDDLYNNISKDAEAEAKRRRVNLDDVLTEEIGQFGWYQLRMLALSVVVVIFCAFAASEYVFTTARISTRCRIPECEAEQAEFSPYWLANAVPASGSSFDQCQRFANVSSSSRIVDSLTCPATLFNRNNVVACEDYVYENTHSVVYDYGLACEEWRRSLIGTVRTLGVFAALPLTGYISDRWGRRVALTIMAFNTAWLGLVRYWADTYIGFMISEFMEATFGSGSFSSAYILLMELVGPKYRVAAGAAMNTTFSIGQMLMGLIAWGVPNWRNLTLALYAPQLITICIFWLSSESYRWLMSKGRYEESETLLKRVAQVNGRQLSEKTIKALRHAMDEDKIKREEAAKTSSNEPWLIIQVFRHKKLLLRVMVSPVWWITNTFIYYGLSINAVNMSGNRYLNYIAVSAAEIPGYWTAVFLMDRIGRKPVLIGAFWLCAACQIAYIFLPADFYAVSLTMYLISKYSIAIVMTSIYVYTNELYPTSHRHSLFAFSSMMGRIGSMIAPLTPAIGAQWFDELPFVLFAAFALLSGILIFLTPETLGTKLPDTFEETENLQQKSKSSS